MADSSPFTVEERLVAVVWYHERRNTNKTTKQVHEDVEERFGKLAPQNQIFILNGEGFHTGSVIDSKHSGRSKIRNYKIIGQKLQNQLKPCPGTYDSLWYKLGIAEFNLRRG